MSFKQQNRGFSKSRGGGIRKRYQGAGPQWKKDSTQSDDQSKRSNDSYREKRFRSPSNESHEGEKSGDTKRVKDRCLLCKRVGHRVAKCRMAKHMKGGDSQRGAVSGICFNCGSSDHSRDNCPQKTQAGGAKFAVCFICQGVGHLSAKCPQNTHGLYPDGGGCRVCGENDHYGKDCPLKQKKKKARRPMISSLADADPTTFEPVILPKMMGRPPIESDSEEEKEEIEDEKEKKSSSSSKSSSSTTLPLKSPKIIKF